MNNAATVDEKRADFYGRASVWNRNEFSCYYKLCSIYGKNKFKKQ